MENRKTNEVIVNRFLRDKKKSANHFPRGYYSVFLTLIRLKASDRCLGCFIAAIFYESDNEKLRDNFSLRNGRVKRFEFEI